MMQIRAQVIDLNIDAPRSTDRFLVDTNVWFWATYPRAEAIDTTYATLYTAYFINGLTIDAAFHRCLVSLAELSHSIERNEWHTYTAANPTSSLSFKHFRRHARLRQAIVRAVDEAWETVEFISGDYITPLMVDKAIAASFWQHYPTYSLDGYDLLLLHAMQQAHLTQLITDDADFGQVADLHVFTANPYLIQQAAQQGRLITRPPDGV